MVILKKPEEDSVASLKARIRDRWHIPVDRMRFDRGYLKDDDTLMQHDLLGNVVRLLHYSTTRTLKVVRPLRGGLSDIRIAVLAYESDTVMDIKMRLRKMHTDVPESNFVLMYQGVELQNDAKMDAAAIADGGELHLQFMNVGRLQRLVDRMHVDASRS